MKKVEKIRQKRGGSGIGEDKINVGSVNKN